MDTNDPSDPSGNALNQASTNAGEALTELAQGAGAEAAAFLEEAFDQTASTIETSLARAARSGELSLKALSQNIAQTLAQLAVERTVDTAFDAIFSAISGSFGGARAAGGFVGASGSYLVGESGPEVFTPASAGRIDPVSARSPVTVNIAMSGAADGSALRRSQGQIATAIAKAVARGQRNV